MHVMALLVGHDHDNVRRLGHAPPALAATRSRHFTRLTANGEITVEEIVGSPEAATLEGLLKAEASRICARAGNWSDCCDRAHASHPHGQRPAIALKKLVLPPRRLPMTRTRSAGLIMTCFSKERWAPFGPFGRTAAPIEQAVRIIAEAAIFWAGV